MDGWWQCCPINYTLNTRVYESENEQIPNVGIYECGMRVRDSHRMSKVFFSLLCVVFTAVFVVVAFFLCFIIWKIFDVVCFYSLFRVVSLSFFRSPIAFELYCTTNCCCCCYLRRLSFSPFNLPIIHLWRSRLLRVYNTQERAESVNETVRAKNNFFSCLQLSVYVIWVYAIKI